LELMPVTSYNGYIWFVYNKFTILDTHLLTQLDYLKVWSLLLYEIYPCIATSQRSITEKKILFFYI
jgi:hypothetical protein